MGEAEVPFEARADKSLLIVDDDKTFSTRLARAMEGRGYAVRVAENVADGLAEVEDSAPAFAVIDMRLVGRQRPRRDRAASRSAAPMPAA